MITFPKWPKGDPDPARAWEAQLAPGQILTLKHDFAARPLINGISLRKMIHIKKGETILFIKTIHEECFWGQEAFYYFSTGRTSPDSVIVDGEKYIKLSFLNPGPALAFLHNGKLVSKPLSEVADYVKWASNDTSKLDLFITFF